MVLTLEDRFEEAMDRFLQGTERITKMLIYITGLPVAAVMLVFMGAYILGYAEFAQSLAEQLTWLWFPALIGVATLVLRAVRPPPDGEPRWGWALLLVSFLVAGPLLALRFNIPPVGLGLYVCQRFHLLPLLLLAVPVALGLDDLARRANIASTRIAPYATGLAVLGLVALTATSLVWLRGVHSPAMDRGIRNVLRSLPPAAVLVVNSEDQCFGADYLQFVEGERPDVDVACWMVTSRQWYRDRLRRHGVPVDGAYQRELTPPQALAILQTGRPLFVDRGQATAVHMFPNYPFGTVIRLLPRGAKQPPLHVVVALNRTLFSLFDLEYPRPHQDDDYAAIAHRRYAITWVAMHAALEAAGDKDAAATALELASQLAPRRD